MTAETIGDIKTNTDANTRAIIIGKLNYKLNLEDSNFQSDKEIGKAWLKGIKRQLDNYDIVEDDQRVGACVRNLTGYVEDLAEHHGKFDSPSRSVTASLIRNACSNICTVTKWRTKASAWMNELGSHPERNIQIISFRSFMISSVPDPLQAKKHIFERLA